MCLRIGRVSLVRETKEGSELRKLLGGRLSPSVCSRSGSPTRQLFRGVSIPRALEGALQGPRLQSPPSHHPAQP